MAALNIWKVALHDAQHSLKPETLLRSFTFSRRSLSSASDCAHAHQNSHQKVVLFENNGHAAQPLENRSGLAWSQFAASSTFNGLCQRGFHSSAGSSAGQDFYDLLGLQRGASEQEIKKAYYEHAKKYHPDTNTNDPAAAKTFQEVQKAYETLRDPQKRSMYDQVGRAGMDRMNEGGGGPQGFPGGFPMFGGMAMQPIRISFMDAIKGTKKRIGIPGMKGKSGSHMDIDIPAGVDSGDQIEVQVAMEGRRQRVRLTIPIDVEPHPVFRRQGTDIHTSQELTLAEALLGTTVTVTTIDGSAELKVPAGTQTGDKLGLGAKGIFHPQRGYKGDQD
eukprot:gene21481-28456_t